MGNKPREWWITASMAKIADITSDSVWDAYNCGPPNPKAIHVIEKSAYDELKGKYDELCDTCVVPIAANIDVIQHSLGPLVFKKEYDKLKWQAERLAEALEEIGDTPDEDLGVRSGAVARTVLAEWYEFNKS